MTVCLGRGEYLHMSQLIPLPLIVSCFSKIQIGFNFLAPAHLILDKIQSDKTVVCVCVCVAQHSETRWMFLVA